MKNKHIVLLFLLTLVMGLLTKMEPWSKRETLQADLMHIAAGDIDHIMIHRPGLAELTLEPDDQGWLTSAGDLTVRTPDSVMAPILSAIARMHSIRIIHSQRPETLMLHPVQALHVDIHLKNGRKEKFDIGMETSENGQPATYIRLESHEGIYLAAGYLRSPFELSAEAFRDRNILAVKPAVLTAVRVYRFECDTLIYERQDTANWQDPAAPDRLISAHELAQWLGCLNSLNGLPFATGITLVPTEERPGLRVELQRMDDEPVFLEFFGLSCSKAPDNTIQVNCQPACAVHSSQNPYNYFELNDASLLKKIAGGLTAVSPAGRR